jgi:hypothetical protein
VAEVEAATKRGYKEIQLQLSVEMGGLMEVEVGELMARIE